MSVESTTIPDVHPTCHCWGPDKLCCIAVQHLIKIYKIDGKNCKEQAVLKAHKHRVTGIDWNHKTNQIVSCGEDRNAYVWSMTDNEWRPTLVVLRVNRAALCVKWSPSGRKFAVGTSAKVLMICNYDKEHDFWVSKSIKKSKSAVLSLSWHKNDVIVAAAGSDMKCRIHNAYIDSVDDDSSEAEISELFPEAKATFGAVLGEYQSLGFVNSVSFSPDGSQLAFSSQSAQLNLVTLKGNGETSHSKKQLKSLPLTTVAFDSAGNLWGAGHDKVPYTFAIKGEELGDAKMLEQKGVKKAAKKGVGAAFNKWNRMADTGKSTAKKASTTVHSFAISDMAEDPNGGMTTICNGDPKLVRWK